MATNEALPVFKPGQSITYRTSAAVIGGRLVEITGDREVAHAAADSAKVVGIAAWSAGIGEEVTVHSGGVLPVLASGAVAAGDRVSAAANGKGATAVAGAEIGVALTSGTDASVDVKTLI